VKDNIEAKHMIFKEGSFKQTLNRRRMICRGADMTFKRPVSNFNMWQKRNLYLWRTISEEGQI
jgi:hypothetical protein